MSKIMFGEYRKRAEDAIKAFYTNDGEKRGYTVSSITHISDFCFMVILQIRGYEAIKETQHIAVIPNEAGEIVSLKHC